MPLDNGRATTTNLLTAMTYEPMGSLKRALYGDGYTLTRTYLFDARNNLTKVTDKITAANPGTFTQTPTKASRRWSAPMAPSPIPVTNCATG